MLTLEYKIDATAAQSAAVDEAIRTVQFIRNKCLSQDCSGTLPDGSRCPERVLKSLSVRTHVCPRCGLVLDRDYNSARLIKERARYRIAHQQLSVPSGRRKRPHRA